MDKVRHVEILLDSFKKKVGRNLIPRSGNPIEDLKAVEKADFVLVSHDAQEDPVLNYGNPKALSLWEMSWNEFIQTPSKETAEAEERETRKQMLNEALQDGYFENYEGVRISKSGNRFRIKSALIWNVEDPEGNPIGQAAVFDKYEELAP